MNKVSQIQNQPLSTFFTDVTKTPLSAYAKIGLEGPKGSGKSTTAALLASGLSAEFHDRSPVVWIGGEKGASFVRPIFLAEKIQLLGKVTYSLQILQDSIREGMKAGAKVAVVDPMTLFWTLLVSDYMKAHNIPNMKYMLSHWATVKEPWRAWRDLFVDCNMHIVVCGRGGFEWDEVDVVDEDGNFTTETRKGDYKMKAEGEFGHEPDVCLHMESMTDPNAPQSGKIKRRWWEGKKAVVGKKIEFIGPRKIHVASVEKGRVWQMNGKTFQWADRDNYQAGEYKQVLDCFRPYLNALNIGGVNQNIEYGENPFQHDQDDAHVFHERRQAKAEALEEIKGNLGRIFSNAVGKDAQFKAEILNQIFAKSSWTGLESLNPEALKDGLFICKRIVELCIDKEPTNRGELIAYVNRAKEEFRNEWAVTESGHVIVGAPYQPIGEQPTGMEVLLASSVRENEFKKAARLEAEQRKVVNGFEA